MKKITSLLGLTLMLTLSVGLSAQSAKGEVDVKVFTNPDIGAKPVEMILVEKAPHLPWVQRTESTEQVFKGQRFNYALESNQERFRSWAQEFPAELEAYRKSMPGYFKANSADDFKGQEQDFYYDMLAQYQMIKQLQGWKH